MWSVANFNIPRRPSQPSSAAALIIGFTSATNLVSGDSVDIVLSSFGGAQRSAGQLTSFIGGPDGGLFDAAECSWTLGDHTLHLVVGAAGVAADIAVVVEVGLGA